MQRLFSLLLSGVLLMGTQTIYAQSKTDYHLKNKFYVTGTGGWDYIAVNPINDNIYVAHGTQVNVIDPDGKPVAVIENTTGVHGIAFVPQVGKGYTSNGKTDNLTVFDINTNETLGQIAAGDKPDAIMYDAFSKNIIVCNGKSKDLSIIDPATSQKLYTVEVGGKPETAVSDNAGHVYVNIEDKNEIVVISSRTFAVEAHWPLHAEAPTGLAIDVKTKRLFAGCDHKELVVVNAENGKIVAKVRIGEGCDGVAFDPKEQLIFSANGEDGTLTVVKEVNANQYKVLQNAVTKQGARTLVVNEKTHLIYLPTAEFEKGQKSKDHHRPDMIKGTFQVLVVGK